MMHVILFRPSTCERRSMSLVQSFGLLLMSPLLLIGCDVPEMEVPGGTASGGNTSANLSINEFEQAAEDIIRLSGTISTKLSEVHDEQSSRVLAAELQSLFAKQLAAFQRMASLEQTASAEQLQLWKNSESDYTSRVRAAAEGMGAEITRIMSMQNIPDSFKRALSLEMKELGTMIQNHAMQSAPPSGTRPHFSGPHPDFSSSGGDCVTILFENAPKDSHRAIGDLVYEAVRNHLKGAGGKRNTRQRGSLVTIKIFGTTDAQAVSALFDLGEVINMNQGSATITVATDASKLPADWESRLEEERERERRREEEFDREMKEFDREMDEFDKEFDKEMDEFNREMDEDFDDF